MKTKVRPSGVTPKHSTSTQKQNVDNQRNKRFTFLSRRRNVDYEDGLRELPFVSCLIHDNSAAFGGPPATSIHSLAKVKTRPKWLTDMLCEEYDRTTGELLNTSIYSTNELKASNASKIKRLDTFCAHFQPLYASKRVSLMFYTLTAADRAKGSISSILAVLKKRLKRRGVALHGYIWTAEISERLHFHYHVAVAIDRLNVRGSRLPEWLMLDDAWGMFTRAEFVRKNVRHYMAKYFAKHNARLIGARSFGSHIMSDRKTNKNKT